jgi:hypothetical protein
MSTHRSASKKKADTKRRARKQRARRCRAAAGEKPAKVVKPPPAYDTTTWIEARHVGVSGISKLKPHVKGAVRTWARGSWERRRRLDSVSKGETGFTEEERDEIVSIMGEIHARDEINLKKMEEIILKRKEARGNSDWVDVEGYDGCVNPNTTDADFGVVVNTIRQNNESFVVITREMPLIGGEQWVVIDYKKVMEAWVKRDGEWYISFVRKRMKKVRGFVVESLQKKSFVLADDWVREQGGYLTPDKVDKIMRANGGECELFGAKRTPNQCQRMLGVHEERSRLSPEKIAFLERMMEL